MKSPPKTDTSITVPEGDPFSLFRDILTAPDRARLREAVLDVARSFGFSAVYYLLAVTRDPSAGRMLINQGFPASWERQYQRRLRLIDPLPGYGMELMRVFRWGSVFKSLELTRAQRRYYDWMCELGMADGLATAVWGPGGRCGFIAFGLAHDPKAFSARSYLGVALAAQLSFNRHCSLVGGDLSAGEIHLSRREIEILHWAARGKSNPDMAAIMGISRATVDTYMRRVFQKFGTNDRTVACMRAHELGFIHAASATASYGTLH